MEERYVVEQTGAHDWGVYDVVLEQWVYDTGSQDDAEARADWLNR